MAKNKRNAAAARARREKKQSARKGRASAPRGTRSGGETDHTLDLPPLPPCETSIYGNVKGADRAYPPVYIGPGCAPASDPVRVLGLKVGRRPTADEVEEAARSALAAHPPEREPDAAREILEARERLIRPHRTLERELGVLYLPDPERFDLPSDPVPKASRRAPDKAPVAETAGPVKTAGALAPSRARLFATMALYALIEDELA